MKVLPFFIKLKYDETAAGGKRVVKLLRVYRNALSNVTFKVGRNFWNRMMPTSGSSRKTIPMLLVAAALPLTCNLVSQTAHSPLRAQPWHTNFICHQRPEGPQEDAHHVSQFFQLLEHPAYILRLLFSLLQFWDGLMSGTKSSVDWDAFSRLHTSLQVFPFPRHCVSDKAGQIWWQGRRFLGRCPRGTRTKIKALTDSHVNSLPKLWLGLTMEYLDGRVYFNSNCVGEVPMAFTR